MKFAQYTLALFLLQVIALPVMAGSHTGPQAPEGNNPNLRPQQEPGIESNTGTDPRDFAPKFMPYYRYTKLENELVQNEVVAFGLFAFSKKFAMTYEIPLAVNRDVGDTKLRQPDGQCSAGFLSGGGSPTLPSGLPGGEGDCEETALGDMNLRFMYRTDWNLLGADWLIGAQFDFPTATKDEVGSETFQVAPLIAPVWNLDFWPGPGAFAALMNFYFTDVWKDSDRQDVSMYVGRWFFMLPLRAPGPGLFDGLYLLPEVQPIYNFEESDASFWIAPEVGKLLAPGRIAYIKPGWGIDPDAEFGERDFTVEVGFRYFMD